MKNNQTEKIYKQSEEIYTGQVKCNGDYFFAGEEVEGNIVQVDNVILMNVEEFDDWGYIVRSNTVEVINVELK